jgi:hypothetical protein
MSIKKSERLVDTLHFSVDLFKGTGAITFVHALADGLNYANGNDGNQGEDNTVLNHALAFFFFEQLHNGFDHFGDSLGLFLWVYRALVISSYPAKIKA